MLITLKAADLPLLADCAQEFYAQSKFLRKFDIARFTAMWTSLLESGAGVIFAIADEERRIHGTIGGLAYPDPYSGISIATEFFWFVKEGRRGDGVVLYREFERWARARGCSELRMVHLLDSMPQKLERFYKHMGYEPAEVHYVKSL